jgi:hypothetical protein
MVPEAIVIGVVCIGIGWIPVKVEQASGQRQAAEEVVRLGGAVLYDWELLGRTEPPGPAWLRELFGDDLWTNVVVVCLESTPTADTDLRHLKRFPQLDTLRLDDTRVTDAGLKHLRGLSRLRVLWLSGTQVTDDGLEHVKGLSQLQTLWLTCTAITDAGLEYLTAFSELEFLSVVGTHVTSEGAKRLQQALPGSVIHR